MDQKKQPKDAGEVAPRPANDDKKGRRDRSAAQDAPNYDNRTDGGRALPDENLNSANDE